MCVLVNNVSNCVFNQKSERCFAIEELKQISWRTEWRTGSCCCFLPQRVKRTRWGVLGSPVWESAVWYRAVIGSLTSRSRFQFQIVVNCFRTDQKFEFTVFVVSNQWFRLLFYVHGMDAHSWKKKKKKRNLLEYLSLCLAVFWDLINASKNWSTGNDIHACKMPMLQSLCSTTTSCSHPLRTADSSYLLKWNTWVCSCAWNLFFCVWTAIW